MLHLCPATACFQGPAKVWGTLHGSRWVRMVGGHSSWLLPTQDDGPGVKKTLTRKLAPAPLQSRKACVMGVWGGQQGAGPHLQVPPQDAMRWGLGFPFALGQGSSPGVCCGHASWPVNFLKNIHFIYYCLFNRNLVRIEAKVRAVIPVAHRRKQSPRSNDLWQPVTSN